MGKLRYGHCSLVDYLFALRRRPLRRPPAIDALSSRIVLFELINRAQLPSLTSPRSPANFPQAEVKKFSSSPATGQLGILRATTVQCGTLTTQESRRSEWNRMDIVKNEVRKVVTSYLWVSRARSRSYIQPLQHTNDTLRPCLALRRSALTETGYDHIAGHPIPGRLVTDFAPFAHSP